jgi:hypothetical protein
VVGVAKQIATPVFYGAAAIAAMEGEFDVANELIDAVEPENATEAIAGALVTRGRGKAPKGTAAATRVKNLEKGIPGSALGPSGKPKVHNIQHSSRKDALDAARQEGKGQPMQHTAADSQPPHFHPVDEAGEKIPGAHHNYPE